MLLRRTQAGRDATSSNDGLVCVSVGYEDLEQRVISRRARAIIEDQEQMLLDSASTGQLPPSPHGPPIDPSQKIDLRPYTNLSAMRIQSTFSVLRTYIVFRTLGLRHLTVVDNLNRVVGMVTRKNLLGHWLETKLREK